MKIFLIKAYVTRFNTRLSLQEQALFAKHLSLIIKAGVPILAALAAMEKQTATKAKKRMLQSILRDVENGQTLSVSLAKFKHVFGNFAISIIRIGEATGRLAENLNYLSEELDKKRKLKQKISGALYYPLLLLIAAISVSTLMTVYLFPKLAPVFKSLHVDLPFTTRMLLFISNALIVHWPLMLLGGAVVCGMFTALMRLKSFRIAAHRRSITVPIVGRMVQHYHLATLCRTIGTLLKSHVHMPEALTIAADTATNLAYRIALESLHQCVSTGGGVAPHLEKNPRLFPHMLTQMIAVGESTGNLDDTFLYLADMYEQELDGHTQRLAATIEPAMMLCMGGLVGLIALSIISPIYAVTQHLGPR